MAAIAARQFAPSMRLRLVDAAGTVQHERGVVRGAFAAQDFRIVRSRDGTAAFVFFRGVGTSVAAVPAGIVRVICRYRRNMMPAEPVLRRRGSGADEVVAVDLPKA